MTVQLPVHEGALTLEQWNRVEELAATLTSAQAQWISGYFAGLDAGLLRGGGGSAAPVTAPQGRTLTILFGTETGNGRDLAKALAAAAAGRGLTPKLVEMAAYKPRQIKDEQDILVVCSTHGEGDPPRTRGRFLRVPRGPPRAQAGWHPLLSPGARRFDL